MITICIKTIKYTCSMTIDIVLMMTYSDIDLLGQGKKENILKERQKKNPIVFTLKKTRRLKYIKVPFFVILLLIKRLTLIDLFNLSVEDLVVDR